MQGPVIRPEVRFRTTAVVLGLFIVPIAFMAVQLWAARSIIAHAVIVPLDDGIRFIGQARDFQFLLMKPDEWASKMPAFLLEYGLYPVFLSGFDFSQLLDWSVGSRHPQVRAVFFVQALVLAACTGLFLQFAFRFVAGSLRRRITTTILLGALLLSPLVIVWPNYVFVEGITFPASLLFAGACLAYDAERKHALVLVGLACCLLILIRDPMIFFVWILAGLLGLNLVLARTPARRSRATVAGAIVVLLAVALGAGRSASLSASGKFTQTFINIIQFRMLPDPERREFFVAHGLPMSPTVEELSGAPAWQDGTLFKPDNEVPADFRAYRDWVVAHGIRTYVDFLVTHPGYVLRSLIESPNLKTTHYVGPDFYFSLADIFVADPSPGYWVNFAPYPDWLRSLLFLPLGLLPFGWLLPPLYLVAFAVRYVGYALKREPASILEMVALAAGASALVAYHTDAWDLWRHTSAFVLLIYFAMIVRTATIFLDIKARLRRQAGGAMPARRRATVTGAS